LPLVYTIIFLLTTKATKLHRAKKKKIGTGVPKNWLRIGKVIITKDAPAQFDRVENGIIYGYTT
jgi:hypothetical protein